MGTKVPLNPSAPEFIPGSLFTPPKAAFHHRHFPHPQLPPPPPPPFFNNDNFPFYTPIDKPTKTISHGDRKVWKPIKPFPYRFCDQRRCLPPRLLKKKVRVSKNFPAKPLPVEDMVETFLAGKTSLMVRNIPNDFGRTDLLRILDKHCRKENEKATAFGYGGERNWSSYDFLYLPMDFVKRANLGYAFVNFTSSTGAVRFHKEFDNYFWANQRTHKICEVTKAKFQGQEDLTLHFKESKFPCHTDEYLPVVLSPPSDGFNGYNLKTLGYRVGSRGGAQRRA